MVDVESVTEEVIKRLGVHLSANMSDLEQVLYEFPSANETLKYPSITIIQAGDADFLPELNPYIHNTPTIEDHKASIQYVVGGLEFNLQLDMWCKNKEQRNDMFRELFKALNTNFPTTMGLSLNLTEYYNTICRYDFTSFSKEDSEVSAQTREWRTRVVILSNCDALLEKEEYMMESLESHTEIPHGTREEKSI